MLTPPSSSRGLNILKANQLISNDVNVLGAISFEINIPNVVN